MSVHRPGGEFRCRVKISEQRSSQMESKTSRLVTDPNDPRSAPQPLQLPSGECNVADPGDERCSPAAVKVILASLPADQREVFSSALSRVGEEERQRFHVVSAAV